MNNRIYKGIACFVALITFSFASWASVLDTVDKEVWAVFKQSLEAADSETFNSIHTDDVIRSWGDKIITGQAFREQNIKVFANPKLPDITIDFSFVSRAPGDNVVYEVGYYRQKLVRGDEVKWNYGMFHVVLKKVEGVWKVAQDWDSSEFNGVKIGASHFESVTLLKPG